MAWYDQYEHAAPVGAFLASLVAALASLRAAGAAARTSRFVEGMKAESAYNTKLIERLVEMRHNLVEVGLPDGFDKLRKAEFDSDSSKEEYTDLAERALDQALLFIRAAVRDVDAFDEDIYSVYRDASDYFKTVISQYVNCTKTQLLDTTTDQKLEIPVLSDDLVRGFGKSISSYLMIINAISLEQLNRAHFLARGKRLRWWKEWHLKRVFKNKSQPDLRILKSAAQGG